MSKMFRVNDHKSELRRAAFQTPEENFEEDLPCGKLGANVILFLMAGATLIGLLIGAGLMLVAWVAT